MELVLGKLVNLIKHVFELFYPIFFYSFSFLSDSLPCIPKLYRILIGGLINREVLITRCLEGYKFCKENLRGQYLTKCVVLQ